MELKIVSLYGKKFKNNSVTCEITGGYGFYNDEKGYLSFKGINSTNGVKTPYKTTEAALQEILDAGGLAHYENIEWLTASN